MRSWLVSVAVGLLAVTMACWRNGKKLGDEAPATE
jgi:hypothetical protein